MIQEIFGVTEHIKETCDKFADEGYEVLGPALYDREAPGFAEAMRAASLAKTPHAMLSRAVSGLRGTTLIINFPGSPRACEEQFAVIRDALPHALEKLADLGGDCARLDE